MEFLAKCLVSLGPSLFDIRTWHGISKVLDSNMQSKSGCVSLLKIAVVYTLKYNFESVTQ